MNADAALQEVVGGQGRAGLGEFKRVRFPQQEAIQHSALCKFGRSNKYKTAN